MPGPLEFAIVNSDTSGEQIYAYITGLSLPTNQRVLVQADRSTLYFPSNPPSIGSALEKDCAIKLGPQGSTTTIRVPQIAGGRIWLSRAKPLVFLLNPGPALVEPSVLNPSDPNAATDFGFAEFTLNEAQLYANITYVDFVPRLPIGVALETARGETQVVTGMEANGLDDVAVRLREQAASDGQAWDKLIVDGDDGTPLRALNPTHSEAVGASFEGYFAPYVDRVWEAFSSPSSSSSSGKARQLRIDTQAAPGILTGSVVPSSSSPGHSSSSNPNNTPLLTIGNETFTKPSTSDIFSSNTGPFSPADASETRLALIPRLAAGFNRSSLLTPEIQPSGQETYYVREGGVTNHYSRIVHLVTRDGKGYGFAYDDVQPSDALDQSGKVNAGDPVRFIVNVGGGGGLGLGRTGAGKNPQGQAGKDSKESGESTTKPSRTRAGLKGLMQKILH